MLSLLRDMLVSHNLITMSLSLVNDLVYDEGIDSPAIEEISSASNPYSGSETVSARVDVPTGTRGHLASVS
jgi:hypothetical protein